jgi:suppressor of fused
MDEADAIDAVNARLAEVYPDQQPSHFGTVRRFAEGGGAPLDGISVYTGHPAHWHFVSYGMSPWGFEFSFRVARGSDAEPPQWALAFLQQLARYVYNTGEPFGPEHFVGWGGPITDAEPTALVALVFAADPVLGRVAVCGEMLTFLSPIGITDAEYEMCSQDLPGSVLTSLLAASPLGVTDLRRGGPAEPKVAPDCGGIT